MNAAGAAGGGEGGEDGRIIAGQFVTDTICHRYESKKKKDSFLQGSV